METFKKIAVIALLGLFVLSKQVSAGILVEPYLGLSLGGSGEAKLNGSKYDYSFSTATYGGRLGYQYLGIMGGVDYSYQDFRLTKEGPGLETKLKTKRNQIGLFAGYEFPILLRVWGTYFLSGKMDAEFEKYSSASGYELGAGFKSLPFLSFNLGYRSITYDHYTPAATFYGEKLNISEVLFYASIPFVIFD